MRHNFVTRVRAGGMFLDEVRPGWRDKIKLNKLRIDESKSCILGQVEGEYDCDSISRNLGLGYQAAEALGFNLFEGEQGKGGSVELYKKLTKAWKKYIRATR